MYVCVCWAKNIVSWNGSSTCFSGETLLLLLLDRLNMDDSRWVKVRLLLFPSVDISESSSSPSVNDLGVEMTSYSPIVPRGEEGGEREGSFDSGDVLWGWLLA